MVTPVAYTVTVPSEHPWATSVLYRGNNWDEALAVVIANKETPYVCLEINNRTAGSKEKR
jgi:hypothetical protein